MVPAEGARRLDPALATAAARYSSATLHEAAGQIGALPSAIKPIAPGMRLCGPAFTVEAAAGDNLWLHRALACAAPGDVLVVTVERQFEAGYWGDIMTTAARRRSLGGLVLDGCVRDIEAIARSGFPIFARGVSIRGTSKRAGAPGRLGGALTVGEARIELGDLVCGDADGVVVVPHARLPEVVRLASARLAAERDVVSRLQAGETTLEIYGWPEDQRR